jgi:cytidylate kinase
LVASTRTRTCRRYKELESTSTVTLQEVEKDLKQRDENASTRDLAPLVPAADAIHIDSTDLSIPEVLDQMLTHIAAKFDDK